MSQEGPPALSGKSAGHSFDRYEILEEIGCGGMGRVVKAYDTQLKRVVALKLLISEDAANQVQVRRFLREARATAQLRHPNIVTLYDIGNDEGRPFYTMELVEGQSLKDFVKRTERIPVRQAVDIMIKVCNAIHYAHIQGIVHRDLKPANVILDKSGEPKVMDFGLAKMSQASKKLSRTGMVLGTLQYMPPEQAQGRISAIDERSDVYGLGAILYEMLTGRPPFGGTSTFNTLYQVLREDPVPLRKIVFHLPQDLESICLKALEKGKHRRYQSALELSEDLARFAAGKAVTARPATALSRLWRARRRLLWAIPVAIFALWFLAGKERPEPLKPNQIEAARQQREPPREISGQNSPRSGEEARQEIARQVQQACSRQLQGDFADARADFENLLLERVSHPELLKPHEPDIMWGMAECNAKREYVISACYFADFLEKHCPQHRHPQELRDIAQKFKNLYPDSPVVKEEERYFLQLAIHVVRYREAMRCGLFDSALSEISEALVIAGTHFLGLAPWVYSLKILAEIGAKNYPNAFRDMDRARDVLHKPKQWKISFLSEWQGKEVCPELDFVNLLCLYLQDDKERLASSLDAFVQQYRNYPEPSETGHITSHLTPLVNAVKGQPNAGKWLEQNITWYPAVMIDYLVMRGIVNINKRSQFYRLLLPFESGVTYSLHYEIGLGYSQLAAEAGDPQDWAKAEHHLKKALALHPMAEIWYWLGNIYMATDRKAEAREALQQYLKNPSPHIPDSEARARLLLQRMGSR